MKSLIWILIVGLPVMVGASPAMTVGEMESILFYYENDIFAGTDKNYSNALKFAWISADLDQYDELGNLIPDTPPFFRCVFEPQRNAAESGNLSGTKYIHPRRYGNQ